MKPGDIVVYKRNPAWGGTLLYPISRGYWKVLWFNSANPSSSRHETERHESQIAVIGASPIAPSAPVAVAPAAKAKPARSCQCGAWVCGGIHSDYCPDYKAPLRSLFSIQSTCPGRTKG